MYFRARYYDPQTGEFISRDPLGYVDGMSQYRAYFVPGGVDPLGKHVVKSSWENTANTNWKLNSSQPFQQYTRFSDGCYLASFWYEYESRSEKWVHTKNYYRNGDVWVDGGGAVATVGSGMMAVGALDDFTGVGILNDPVLIGGGAVVTVVGLAEMVGGGFWNFGDYMTNGELPTDTSDSYTFRRYRNFTWKYRVVKKVQCGRDCLTTGQIPFDPPLDFPSEGWLEGPGEWTQE